MIQPQTAREARQGTFLLYLTIVKEVVASEIVSSEVSCTEDPITLLPWEESTSTQTTLVGGSLVLDPTTIMIGRGE